jgi:hypothetical protein
MAVFFFLLLLLVINFGQTEETANERTLSGGLHFAPMRRWILRLRFALFLPRLDIRQGLGPSQSRRQARLASNVFFPSKTTQIKLSPQFFCGRINGFMYSLPVYIRTEWRSARRRKKKHNYSRHRFSRPTGPGRPQRPAHMVLLRLSFFIAAGRVQFCAHQFVCKVKKETGPTTILARQTHRPGARWTGGGWSCVR